MSELPQHVQDAARKIEQEFSLDPDLPEGVSVRFDTRPLEPAGLQCEFAGHSWLDAGGGLQICALCEAERWEDPTEWHRRPCPEGVDDTCE